MRITSRTKWQRSNTRRMAASSSWMGAAPSKTNTILVHAICPAPHTLDITRRPCSGYALWMRTNAALWKQPNIGRW